MWCVQRISYVTFLHREMHLHTVTINNCNDAHSNPMSDLFLAIYSMSERFFLPYTYMYVTFWHRASKIVSLMGFGCAWVQLLTVTVRVFGCWCMCATMRERKEWTRECEKILANACAYVQIRRCKHTLLCIYVYIHVCCREFLSPFSRVRERKGVDEGVRENTRKCACVGVRASICKCICIYNDRRIYRCAREPCISNTEPFLRKSATHAWKCTHIGSRHTHTHTHTVCVFWMTPLPFFPGKKPPKQGRRVLWKDHIEKQWHDAVECMQSVNPSYVELG